jgi:CubicO group peptidase (beta-lactamase class C family)
MSTASWLLTTGLPGLAAEVDQKKIDVLIDQALADWQVPGAAVVIVDSNNVLYLGGRGIREIGKPGRVTPDTVFPLGSCSKAFTTTIMAMLADDGKLAWDDPVRKHLKTFHLSEPLADGDVRLRDLVSHRTGVGSHDLLWYRAPWSQEEMVQRVGRLPLSKPFRSAMQYQSVMFIAAGQAAANAAGKPWEDLVDCRILKPLGMKTTNLTTPQALRIADHSSAHRKAADGVNVIPWYSIAEPNPAGSVNSTARDLAAWLQFHLNEGRVGDATLVSAKHLQDTHSPQIVIAMDAANQEMHPFTQQMSYGMAWVIQDYRGELEVSHAGLIDGFRAHLMLLPKKKLGLAILCNLDQTRMNLALSNQIADLLLGAPPKDWNAHYRKIVAAGAVEAIAHASRLEGMGKAGTRPSLALENYEGSYEDPAYGAAKIRLDKGELWLEWSSFRCRLQHFQDDSFRILDDLLGQTPLEFHVVDGRVERLTAVGVEFKRK